MVKLKTKQEIILKYYREGKSFRRIAREVGVSRITTTKYIKEYEAELFELNGYGHKPGQYDKSVCYDVPWFRCPGKGQFCKMLYYPFKWIIKLFPKQSFSRCSAIGSFRVVVVDYC